MHQSSKFKTTFVRTGTGVGWGYIGMVILKLPKVAFRLPFGCLLEAFWDPTVIKQVHNKGIKQNDTKQGLNILIN